MKIVTHICLLLLLCSYSESVGANSEAGGQIYCVYFDHVGNTLTNFEPGIAKVLGVQLPEAKVGESLHIEAQLGFSIWKKDKLIFSDAGNGYATYIIDTLILNEKAKVVFSLFHQDGINRLPVIYLNRHRYSCINDQDQKKRQNTSDIEQVPFTDLLPYSISLFVFCIIVMVLIKNLETDNYLNFFAFTASKDGKHHPGKFDLSKSSLRFIILIVLLNIGGISSLWLLNFRGIEEPVFLIQIGIFDKTHPYALPIIFTLIYYLGYIVFTFINNYIFGLLRYTSFIISQELRVITFFQLTAMATGVILRLNNIHYLPFSDMLTIFSAAAFVYLTVIIWQRLTLSNNISRAYLFYYICTAKLLPLIIIYRTFLSLFTKQST